MRKFAIKKCAMVARRQGFPAFALENGGQCLGGKNILAMYNMYGPSGACRPDGKGGPWSMEVFKFKRKMYFLFDIGRLLRVDIVNDKLHICTS